MRLKSNLLLTGMKFVIPALTGPYVHLFDQHFLSVKVRMCLKNGEKLPNMPGTEEVPEGSPPLIAPVNNILHSLFETVSVHFSKILVNPSSKYYPWKAYLNTLLSFNSEAKSTWLMQQGW